MEKSRILQIVMLVWVLLFIAFAVYKLTNAPELCSEPGIDPVTHERIGEGGCNPQYGQVIMGMILPFVVWAIIFAILLIVYFISKR